MRSFCVVTLVSLLLLAVAAQAAVAGLPPDSGSGNCIPFGCTFSGFGSSFYQQVYAASDFSGAFTINTLSFYNTQFNNSPGQSLNDMTFSIYLSTTGVAVNGIDDGNPAYTANLGADNALFGTYTIGGAFPFGGTLSFSGNGFNYDPNNGNLLLTIVVSSIIGNQDFGSITFFDQRYQDAGGMFSRYTDFGTIMDDTGLVTGFNESQPVPEPASLTLLGTGLLAVVRKIRRCA